MNGLTHISLFTGIGGFDLAAEWAGFRTIAMCEIDPFCQEVLKARFGAIADAARHSRDGQEREKPGRAGGTRDVRQASPRRQDAAERPLLIPDIFAFDGTRFRGATLLTGGFPCQPFSHAGKRRGREDDRALWPEMRRVISESRPRWVIGENVSGLIGIEDGMAFEQVCLDLEGMGYEVQPFHIGAVGVNAPHRRMRVWIVGYAGELGLSGVDGGRAGKEFADGHRQSEHSENNTEEHELSTRNAGRSRTDSRPPASGSRDSVGESNRDAPDDVTNSQDSNGRRAGGQDNPGRGAKETGRSDSWDIPWIEVASRLCGLDDELSAGLVGYLGITEEHLKVRDKNRVQKLKALGNAIVPAVAFQIIRCIAEIENGNKTR